MFTFLRVGTGGAAILKFVFTIYKFLYPFFFFFISQQKIYFHRFQIDHNIAAIFQTVNLRNRANGLFLRISLYRRQIIVIVTVALSFSFCFRPIKILITDFRARKPNLIFIYIIFSPYYVSVPKFLRNSLAYKLIKANKKQDNSLFLIHQSFINS